MRHLMHATVAALALAAAPAMAQDAPSDDNFNGPYVGGSFGIGVQNNDVREFQRFDRGFDGSYDTITTTTGANAFSPGFCNGAANGPRPANACRNDKDDIAYHGRIGWDARIGDFVVGVLGEFGRTEVIDSVSSFSTTPAFYTMTREIEWEANIRGRFGYAAGGKTLFYATGGPAYARIKNSFTTSNTVNAFSDNGRKLFSKGAVFGGGVEQALGRNFSVGLEYLYTRYTEDDYRVRATAGNAVASNPFVLNGQPGTEFSRSDPRFDFHTMRVTAAFRF
ncbi:outer membrane protein [Sphingomonas yantingensis]|jgi:outer membrane immunogenic protein|uniref:Outer membrane immunogenic protein n=2 Tax=Sphingomonas TaxID=13687 RepID=A0A7W9AP28_9SPHN|nr:outer membrane beta-barrel protein [Sphingomonas yantingensis]MBB5697945.1 outer membrane immunogenic protein [Sphingomonas yantingensis]HCB75264.1 hypothetical protein [Sphingomonas bacterium]